MSDRAQIEELTPTLLLHAYAAGVFPMAESADSEEVLWIDPDLRGIVPLERFHVPKSLRKRVLKGDVRLTVDLDFEGVIDGCANRESTWINPEIRRLYIALHRMGHAHSVEVWRPHATGKTLVGGLYGVRIGGAFFGESMFSHETDASKIAFVYLVARLKAGRFRLLDTQFVTEHLAKFGARAVPRGRYQDMLEFAMRNEADWDALDDGPEGLPSPQEVVQLSTQTSYL